MNKEIENKIKTLQERRALLCDECASLEYEVRMLEDEIEKIDKEVFKLELPPEECGDYE